MALKLYFSPGACSFVPHCLLELAGASFEPVMIKLHKGEHRQPEFKAINALGQVPVLVDGERVLTHILAITVYLDGLFPQAHLLPTDLFERAQVLQMLAWMNNTAHPTFTHVFRPSNYSPDAHVQADIKAHASEHYRAHLQSLDAFVAKRLERGEPWLAGEFAGPLDAYALTLCRWGTIAGLEPSQFPALWAHVQAVAKHPDIARAVATERLVLNTLESPPKT